MKLLWLSNMIPAVVEQNRSGRMGNGRWIDRTLADLRKTDVSLLLLCRGPEGPLTQLDSQVSYLLFGEKSAELSQEELEEKFRELLRSFQPDVIHIWGTEYGHTLAMVNSAAAEGMENRVVISLQGLCSAIGENYGAGLPEHVINRSTVRDFLRRDNIRCQQEKYRQRGLHEREALQKVRHVIGRTDWDKNTVLKINGALSYHHCGETLRDPFYRGTWQYGSCRKHQIFVSSCDYPVKGFHFLLQAMPEILKSYPDARIVVPGRSYFPQKGIRDRLRRNSYQNYLWELTRTEHLTEKITFLGGLDAEQMKKHFLESHIFVLCSTIENSPNALGEAMMLGVPAAAASVGGVPTMMKPGEGILYDGSDYRQLAEAVKALFAMEEKAEQMGRLAAEHAGRTHDPHSNLAALQNIYREIAGEGETEK